MKTDPKARYLKSHEWARREGELYVIGITDYAQSTLSDIVYLELPEVDDELGKDDPFGTVESVKAASDVFMPLGGTVVEVNDRLADAPEIVNEDAFGSGWLLKIKPADPDEWESLLDVDAYVKAIEEEGH